MRKQNSISFEEGEVLEKKIRKSIIVFFPSFFISFSLLFFVINEFGGISFFIFFLLSIFFSLRAFFLWHGNIFYLTNRRLIFWSQQNFFHRVISDIPFSKIQNFSFRRDQWLEKIFSLGTLEIQIEGTHVFFGMSHIHRPEKILSLLQTLKEKMRAGDTIFSSEIVPSSKFFVIEGDFDALSKDDLLVLSKEIIQLLTKIRKKIGKESFRQIFSLPKNK